jgi:hypothetical protein
MCHKLLKRVECEGCISFFVLLDKTSVLFSNTLSSYFNVIDRGSLKYPSDAVINILVTYLFKVMISERYEYVFLNSKCQRTVLMSVMYNVIDSLDFDVCQSCGKQLNTFLKKCIFTFCNVLLDNYSRVKNNSVLTKARKPQKREN